MQNQGASFKKNVNSRLKMEIKKVSQKMLPTSKQGVVIERACWHLLRCRMVVAI